MRVIHCWECGGRGSILFYKIPGDPKSGLIIKVCDECDGTGHKTYSDEEWEGHPLRPKNIEVKGA